MTTEEIIYNEAVRAITQQAGSLDELRTRASNLLAVIALVMSFLAAHAPAGGRSLGPWGGAALALSVLGAGPLRNGHSA